MKYRTFGKSGTEISLIGFGAASVGSEPDQQKQSLAIMEALLDNGVNFIDTAACYPGSEELIGKGLSHRRGEFWLSTKCGHHQTLPDGGMRSLPVTMKDIDEALKRLNTDWLDSMLLHSYDMDLLEKGEAIEVLRKAKEAGKVRFIGYSGDNEGALFAARHADLDVLETSVNICDLHGIGGAVSSAAETNKGVVAKRPLANAIWRYGKDEAVPEHYQVYRKRWEAMGLTESLLEEAGATDWVELALRFTLTMPGVNTAIIGTSRMENAQSNLKAAEKGPLNTSLAKRISEIYLGAEKASGEPWLGQN